MRSKSTAYKKDKKEADAKQDKMKQYMLHLDMKMKDQKKWLFKLKSKLVASKGELVRLSPQLAAAKAVRDRAFRNGYGAGVANSVSNVFFQV